MIKKLKIYGGPGCGKTFTLMQFYKEALDSGYNISDITLITFRKTSANFLIDVVAQHTKLDEKTISAHVGTIHSICWRLLSHPSVISLRDIRQFLTDFGYSSYVKPRKIHTDDEDSAFSGDLFDLYAWLRNTCTSIENWTNYPGSGNVALPWELVPVFIRDYEVFKKSIHKIDFSDMLQSVIDSNIPLDTPILMIDEFQDLTSQMYRLFLQWASTCERVIIAGDPLQSIYGFWGGSPLYFDSWEAETLLIRETRRLPQCIYDFASEILRFEGMCPPALKGKSCNSNSIQILNRFDTAPCHATELHLVRCNYQSDNVAKQLAEEGKIFSGLRGWTEEELQLANAIIKYRQHKILTIGDLEALILAFPPALYSNLPLKDLEKQLSKAYSTDLRKNATFLKPMILDSLCSSDPTAGMTKSTDLLSSKIKGVLHRKSVIMSWECSNRKILTIHGSKGLEADAIFLHKGITPRIEKAIVIPGEDSEAEARVWFVGATRAKEVLYLIEDKGHNYTLPEVAVC